MIAITNAADSHWETTEMDGAQRRFDLVMITEHIHVVLANPRVLVVSGLDQRVRHTNRIGEQRLVTSGHTNKAELAETSGHAGVPSVLAWRHDQVLRSDDEAAGNVEGVEGLHVEARPMAQTARGRGRRTRAAPVPGRHR